MGGTGGKSSPPKLYHLSKSSTSWPKAVPVVQKLYQSAELLKDGRKFYQLTKSCTKVAILQVNLAKFLPAELFIGSIIL